MMNIHLDARVTHRVAISCAVVTAALIVSSAAEAAWCVRYRGDLTSCGFSSQAQCLATVSGVEGSCYPDPRAGASNAEPAPRRATVKPDKKKQAAPRAPQKDAPAVAKESAAPSKPPLPSAIGAPAPPSPAVPVAAAAAAPDFATARKLVLEGQYQPGLAALQTLGFDDHPEVAAYIGLAHRRLGRIDEARSWYEKALRADPNHILTLSFYGILRAEQGDLGAARKDLEKIKQLCRGDTCNEYRALESVIAASPR